MFISNLLLIYDLHFYKTSEWAVCKESTVQHRTQSMWEYRSSMQVHTEEYTCEWQISVTHQAATSSDHIFIVNKLKTTQNQDVHSLCPLSNDDDGKFLFIIKRTTKHLDQDSAMQKALWLWMLPNAKPTTHWAHSGQKQCSHRDNFHWMQT